MPSVPSTGVGAPHRTYSTADQRLRPRLIEAVVPEAVVPTDSPVWVPALRALLAKVLAGTT
jgi:hypothetical protein